MTEDGTGDVITIGMYLLKI